MNPFISRMLGSLFSRFKRIGRGEGGGLIGPVCQGGEGGSSGLPPRNLSQIHTQWQSVTLQRYFLKFIKENLLTKKKNFKGDKFDF